MPTNKEDSLSIQKQIGERIKYLQKRAGLSQEELADKVGMARAVVSRVENGTRPIRDTELLKFADVFEVTTDYLLGRKTDLGDVPVAAHFTDDYSKFSPKERKEIDDYIEFKKAQWKKRHENENKD